MKKVRWLSAAAGAALVAATFALPGAGVAYASGNGNITGNGNLSLLSGNTVNAPVSAPVNLCGVSLAVLGFANSGCQGGATSNCHTPPPCEHNCHTPSPCKNHSHTPPPCKSDCHTPPPSCRDHGNCTPPPPCHGNCTPPTGPGTPPGTGPSTTTTVTTSTTPGSTGLPTTGADLLLLGVAAIGSIGAGAGAVALARRRRNGEAS